jgi:hypothetical protein
MQNYRQCLQTQVGHLKDSSVVQVELQSGYICVTDGVTLFLYIALVSIDVCTFIFYNIFGHEYMLLVKLRSTNKCITRQIILVEKNKVCTLVLNKFESSEPFFQCQP